MATGTQLWTYGSGGVYKGVGFLCHPTRPNGAWYGAGWERSPAYKKRVWKSTNFEGTSWSEQDASNAPTTAYETSICACYNPHDGCIWILYKDATGYPCVAAFKTYNATGTTDIWDSSKAATLESVVCNYVGGIDYDPNGKIHVTYSTNTTSMGNTYTGVYYTNNVNGWKTPILLRGGGAAGFTEYAYDIQTDSSGVPHILGKNDSTYDLEWSYGNQNDATSFTWGTFLANQGMFACTVLYMDTNNKMQTAGGNTWFDKLDNWTESTFPSATRHSYTDGTKEIQTSSYIWGGTEEWCSFQYYNDADTNLYMRKHTTSWSSTKLTLQSPGSTMVCWMENSHRSAFPEAMGYFHGDDEAPYFERYMFVMRLIPAAAVAGTSAVWPLPPTVVSPADALAGAEASCTVTTSGPQTAEPAPAAANCAASVTVFQSSVTQTPGLAAAGTYAFVILQSDNHEYQPDGPAPAQAWASISAVLVGTDYVYCTPAPARARAAIGPDFLPVVDERPFDQGFLMLPALRVHSGTLLPGEAGWWWMTLPRLEAWGFLDVNVLLAASAVLPTLRLDGVGPHGGVGSGAGSLRPLEAAAGNTERVGEGHVYLWRPTADGVGLTGMAGAGALILESLRLNALGPGMGGEMAGAAVLPVMEVLSGTVASGFNFDGHLLLPRLFLHGADERTLQFSGAATFPSLLAAGTGGEAASGWAVLTLPALAAVGITEFDIPRNVAAGLLGVVVSAMHTGDGSVTDFENYQFNSYAQLGQVCLGASPDGIFSLDGDADDGLAIDAELRKVDVDLTLFHHKRVTDAYIHLHSSGPFRILSFANGVPADTLVADGLGLHAHKVNLARGLVGSQLGFGYANEDGSDFLLDQIDYLVEVTSRRHG